MISLLATLLLLMMRLPHKRHNMLPLTLCQKCVFNPGWWLSTQDLSSGYIDFEKQSNEEYEISQLVAVPLLMFLKRHNMLPPTLCQKCISNPAWWLSTQDLSNGYIEFEKQSWNRQQNRN